MTAVDRDTLSINDMYKQIIIPEIEQYRKKDINIDSISYIVKNIYNNLHNDISNKDKIIKYIRYNNSNNYTIDFISTLLYERYIFFAYPIIDDLIYNRLYVKPSVNTIIFDLFPVYNIKQYEDIIKDVITYYDQNDKKFANYLRSITCILWIIRYYYDKLIENKTFNRYVIETMMELVTPDIFEEIKSKIDSDKWGQTERDHYDAIYCYMRYEDKESKYT
jgi:hypothetical protein